jgi:hypothetical protein
MIDSDQTCLYVLSSQPLLLLVEWMMSEYSLESHGAVQRWNGAPRTISTSPIGLASTILLSTLIGAHEPKDSPLVPSLWNHQRQPHHSTS